MSTDIDALYGTRFMSGGMAFFVDDNGFVQSDDGTELGHIEECMEEGKAIMDLTELCETIDFGV